MGIVGYVGLVGSHASADSTFKATYLCNQCVHVKGNGGGKEFTSKLLLDLECTGVFL